MLISQCNNLLIMLIIYINNLILKITYFSLQSNNLVCIVMITMIKVSNHISKSPHNTI